MNAGLVQEKTGEFAPVDNAFAGLLARMDDSGGAALRLAALLVSRSLGRGHSCLDLWEWAGREVDGERCPEMAAWRDALLTSPVVAGSGGRAPLILDDAGRLYLKRLYDAEMQLAVRLRELSSAVRPLDHAAVAASLRRLFPGGEQPDWQMIAALVSVRGGVSVITGGPGTGKTTTVARILALLLEQDPGVHIALAAPTGKAANRLQESVRASLETLVTGGRGRIGDEALTLHRLLGYRPGDGSWRFDERCHLPFDVVVVDEASMVSLMLMSRLVRALKPGARLILLGDREQLASVEAGYVLGDICEAGLERGWSGEFAELVADVADCPLRGAGPAGFGDAVVELKKTWRFDARSGIGKLSRAVNAGDAHGALTVLAEGGAGLTGRDLPAGEESSRLLTDRLMSVFGDCRDENDPEQWHRALQRFRILCGLRRGPFGTDNINALCERLLAAAGLIRPGRTGHYHGRPVLVTANDYALGLFNGDVGVELERDGELRVWFEGPQGMRDIAPARLPAHETCFAMTVHKSQGSEFEEVLFILPDQDAAVLSRELVYTGITRARTALELWYERGVFASAVERRIQRSSGLRDALVGESPDDPLC